MHIRRFEGASMKAVLAEIREELGEDALILSSRTFRKGRGAFGLMSQQRVEVQAALERAPIVEASSESASTRSEKMNPMQPDSEVSSSLEDTVRALQADVQRLRDREEFEEELRSEMRGLRAAMQSAMVRSGGAQLDPVVEAMTGEGLDWVHAESVAKAWQTADHEGGLVSVETILADRIGGRLVAPRADEGDRLRILVGAPGVGKTTSLAKLAARNEEGERDVTLASVDHYRIGATSQLRDYAALLEAPFCEIKDVDELPAVLNRFRGRSVLLDTAGRGPTDGPSLGSLRALRKTLGKRLSVDLVLDATTKRCVQRAQVERFASLVPDRILLTKTDECDSMVDIANLALDEDCAPICWLGTGQRVPQDLELADARTLARSVLGRAA